jgi:hypothetical protein
MNRRRKAWSLLALFAAIAAASGCASEDTAGRFLVAPDKFVLYNCAQLNDAAQNNFARQQELEKLIAKAEQGSGGTIVSDMTYRPEYVQLRGEMNELRRTTAEKNCKPLMLTSSPSSGSSGGPVGGPNGRASDQVIR